jgi:hypothetical protein
MITTMRNWKHYAKTVADALAHTVCDDQMEDPADCAATILLLVQAEIAKRAAEGVAVPGPEQLHRELLRDLAGADPLVSDIIANHMRTVLLDQL